MTLNGYFKTRASFGAHHEILNEDRLYCQRRRYSPMTLDSGNVRFMRIFAVVLKIYVNFSEILCLRPYITPLRYQVQLFCLSQLSTNTAAVGCEVHDCGDVASGGAKCDPRSIWNSQKTADLSRTLNRRNLNK